MNIGDFILGAVTVFIVVCLVISLIFITLVFLYYIISLLNYILGRSK